ncbi:MAG: sterol desaturase family protein [Bacteroidia bacterium]|nr:sterol desaturase family protein [Bacteroidia bacterium]
MVVIGFTGMECMAWFSHKYVMHGFLWSWHKSHHEPRYGRFELNDLFGVFFALVAILFIVLGAFEFDWRFFLGIGITLYGFAYFLVHDVFVHQRLPWLKKTKSPYFQAMRFAHKVHHKTSGKYGAESFGFLYVGKKYLQKYSKPVKK